MAGAGPSAGGNASASKASKFKLGAVSLLSGIAGRKADTLEDIMFRLEKEQIERTQEARKVGVTSTNAALLNAELDNQTQVMVQMAELEVALRNQ